MAGKPEDAISDEYVLLRRLEKNRKSFTGGGDNVIGSVEYKLNTTVDWIADTDTLSTNRVDIFDQWTTPWRQLGETVVMSSFEEAINRGEQKKFDLLAGKLENARVSMRSKINESLFTAQTGRAVLGLPDLASSTPTTGTVEGINRADWTFWRNQQTTGTQSSAAFDNLRASMRTIHAACSKGQGSMEPEFYISTSTVVNGYEALLIANERVTSKDDSQANAGFKSTAFKFRMADVIWDRDCPSATMYALRNDNPKIAIQSGSWFKAYPAVDPANQLLDVYKLETIMAFVTGNPRHLGVITAIS